MRTVAMAKSKVDVISIGKRKYRVLDMELYQRMVDSSVDLETTGIFYCPASFCSYLLAERNSNNRPFRKRKIAQIRQDCIENRWRINGESIIIGIKGGVLDGQNRLKAGVEAGTGITSVFGFGFDESVFPTIDSGDPRTLGDHLKVSGLSGSDDKWFNSTFAAAVNLLYSYEKGEIQRAGRTPSSKAELVDFAELPINKPLKDSMLWVSENMKDCRINFPPAVVTFTHYLGSYRANRQEDTETFLLKVKDGSLLSPNDPAFKLRERLIEENKPGFGMNRKRDWARYVLKALRLALDGESINRLLVRKDEKLPIF